MEIILLENVYNLGQTGDTVRVKNGYARNYLLPQGKALRATNENKADFEARRAEIEKQNAAKKSAAEADSKKIDNQFLVLIRQASDDGHLYGSVTARDIADTLEAAHKLTLDKTQVVIQKPIKELGIYTVTVRLHPEIAVPVRVNVARTEAEADEAKEAFLNPAKAKKKDKAEGEEGAAEAEEETIASVKAKAEAASKAQAHKESSSKKKKAKKAKEAEAAAEAPEAGE